MFSDSLSQIAPPPHGSLFHHPLNFLHSFFHHQKTIILFLGTCVVCVYPPQGMLTSVRIFVLFIDVSSVPRIMSSIWSSLSKYLLTKWIKRRKSEWILSCFTFIMFLRVICISVLKNWVGHTFRNRNSYLSLDLFNAITVNQNLVYMFIDICFKCSLENFINYYYIRRTQWRGQQNFSWNQTAVGLNPRLVAYWPCHFSQVA